MSLLLSIETATEICSICVSKGAEILAERGTSEVYQHIEAITTLIQEVTEEAGVSLQEIDAIALSEGPGSYTALRVGAATAKGICYTLDKPLIAISTLKSLAWAMKNSSNVGYFLPMIDARRMEVYAALFDHNLQEMEAPAALLVTDQTNKSYQSIDAPIFIGGNGAEKCTKVLGSNFIYTEVECNAKNLVSLAIEKYQARDFVDLAYFSPFYLKPPNITVSKKKL